MNDQGGFDPKRRLCPDGSCTGVIGADGRCSECGRAAGGASAYESNGSERANEARGDAPSASGRAAAGGGDPGAFDPTRRLCDDGACTGVIGADGSCTVCGRVAS